MGAPSLPQVASWLLGQLQQRKAWPTVERLVGQGVLNLVPSTTGTVGLPQPEKLPFQRDTNWVVTPIGSYAAQ